jgi:hypothetical protein
MNALRPRSPRAWSSSPCRNLPDSDTGRSRRIASRRSVFTLRVRVAYIGEKFGSATMTSWPKASRHRATHSLSVEASITIRARCGCAARRSHPLGEDVDLAVPLVHVARDRRPSASRDAC